MKKRGSRSTELAPVERDARGRIVRGALNPGGRPSEEREVVKALRLSGLALAEKLIELGLKGNVKAIEVAFNRAYGKPKQVVAFVDDQPRQAWDLSKLSLDEKRTLRDLVAKACGRDPVLPLQHAAEEEPH